MCYTRRWKDRSPGGSGKRRDNRRDHDGRRLGLFWQRQLGIWSLHDRVPPQQRRRGWWRRREKAAKQQSKQSATDLVNHNCSCFYRLFSDKIIYKGRGVGSKSLLLFLSPAANGSSFWWPVVVYLAQKRAKERKLCRTVCTNGCGSF